MTVTKIMTRRMADLITPSDMGENLLKFNKVVLPCGRMPAGYESVEGITISQLGDIIIEHLDVAGLIPDLSGGSSGATQVAWLNFTVNSNPTIQLEDVEILLMGNVAKTMRVIDAVEKMPDPNAPNYFVAVANLADKLGFMNADPSNKEIEIAIRLIPENQDTLQNITFSGNPTFKWKPENAAYVGKLLPFKKPVLGPIERTVLDNGNYRFTGTMTNMDAGVEYGFAVSVKHYPDDGTYQMNYLGNDVNTNTPNFDLGNIPNNVPPYTAMGFVRDFVGYRDIYVFPD